MNQTVTFCSFISVAQKTQVSGPYGDGFNYHVEVVVNALPDQDSSSVPHQISEVTSVVDHKALGIDFDLGQEATTNALFVWLETRLKQKLADRFRGLKLVRGDGLEVFSPEF